MSAFSKIKLGDAVTFQRGFDITKVEQTLGEVPIISSSGISSTHNQSRAKGPGVIIGRKGTLGTVHFVRQDYWPHDTTLWVKDFKNSNPEFISYFLRTLKLENFDTGSSNPTLNRNHLHKIGVVFPKEPATQRKIAAILAVYDDLIETNKRRITLLEKMAAETYREWFVRMRFPGYRDSILVKGVPKGWEATQFGQIANITMGQSPKSEFYNNSGQGLPFHQGVGTYGDRFPRKVTFCTANGRKAKKGSILFSVRAPVGRLNIADCEVIIGRGIAAIRHKEGKNSYLYYLLKTIFANEDIIGNGSIFNSVGKDELARFAILTHPNALIARFEEFARPIDQQIETLIHSNSVLTETRDLLLPRLISGKLSVADLDIQFPPSMREGDEEAERKALDSTSESGQVHRL
ncbi:MAG: restriction endonuclease subunit S [Lamprocystis purpurea]|jgi:type I restriction enzyme S subunit|uniref:restriction endonuclease subunit S n=1 Tax=Lamprocystis purpurea TaxID=61598 RepID=UPI00036DB7B1|nr:restriction endonuclease subunit S [Lamprocystis purpurea]MBV5272611.1 restriction endonuclease subunit S [Lamprocystis purpurea]